MMTVLRIVAGLMGTFGMLGLVGGFVDFNDLLITDDRQRIARHIARLTYIACVSLTFTLFAFGFSATVILVSVIGAALCGAAAFGYFHFSQITPGNFYRGGDEA